MGRKQRETDAVFGYIAATVANSGVRCTKRSNLVSPGFAGQLHGGGSSGGAGHQVPADRQHASGHVMGQHEEGRVSRRG